MSIKKKHGLRFWIVTGLLIILMIIIAAVVINIPKPQQVSDSSFDLEAIADGTYQGKCDNGLVSVTVEVDVQNHSITNVNILKHQNGMGQAAESIADSVTANQSVEVDTVTGATMSSQTILKAVENALTTK
ncbi:MAG: FMN-binding protein [Lachnospiraceae bacterium]